MKGLLTWMGTTVASIQSDIRETISQTTSFITFLYQSTFLKEAVYQSVLQGWQGFSRVLDPALVTALIRSKNMQNVLMQSLQANMSYLGVVLLYEAYLKPLLHTMEHPYAEYYIDLLIQLYFIRSAIRMYVNNTSYNMCIYQATVMDNPINEQEKFCKDGSTAIIQGCLASSVYFVGNLGAIYVVSSVFPSSVGRYVSVSLKLLLYGQNFLEYKLSDIGMCTTHRYEILNRNNAYAFGLGLSFYCLQLGSHYVLNHNFGVGIDNYYIGDAVFSILFQHYIMVSLLIDKPLPGNELGRDIFYYSRFVIEPLMKQGSDWIVLILRQQKTEEYWLTKFINMVYSYPPNRFSIRLIIKFFFGTDIESLYQFVRRPAIKLYLDSHEKKIQSAIEWVIQLHNNTYVKSISYLTDYLPSFIISTNEKKVLDLLLEEKLKNILIKMNYFINTVQLKKIEPLPVIKIINLERLQGELIEDYPVKTHQPKTIAHENNTISVAHTVPSIEISTPVVKNLDDNKLQPIMKNYEDDFLFLENDNKSNLQKNSLFFYVPFVNSMRKSAREIKNYRK
jgi:hypothetical protein